MSDRRTLVALLFAILPGIAGGSLGAQEDRRGADLSGADILGWTVGEADAPIDIVELTDVSCPYCASFHSGTRARLVEEFVEGGQVRWITLTYVSGQYRNSEAVSRVAECAGRQGRYEAFLEAAYASRDDWVNARSSAVDAAIERMIDTTGVDRTALETCRTDPAIQERLDAVVALARRTGVRGTPTWFVDGFLVMGDLPHGYARSFIVRRLPGGGR